MSDQNQYAVTTGLSESPKSLEFKDQSTGLAIFGTIQIAMGGFSAMMVPFMVLSMSIAPQQAGTSAAQMIPAIGMYAIFAVLFLWLGIGSFRARRWARALTLVLAWMWLVVGVISLISMVFMMPSISEMMTAQTQQPPPAMMSFVIAVMFVMMGGIYIVLPGVFILFYKRADVKATCEWRDPTIRWTDRCPLPVLSLCLMLAFGSTSVLWSAGYGFVMPFFGTLLKGTPGALLVFSISALFGYLAWAIYKLKLSAWWATLVSFVLFGLSTVITFSVIEMVDMYREMGFPKEQIDIMKRTGTFGMNYPLMMSLNTAVVVAYLIWVRRYFDASTEPPSSESKASGGGSPDPLSPEFNAS